MEIFKILGTVLINTSKAEKSLDDTTKKAKNSEEKMSKSFKNIGEAVKKGFQEKQIEKTNKSLASITTTVGQQETRLEKLKKRYVDLCAAQGKNSKEAKEVAGQIESVSKELSKNRTKLADATTAADKYDKSLHSASETVAEFGKKLGAGMVSLAKWGAKAVAVTATAAAALTTMSVKSAAAYETNFAKVSTLLSGSEADMEKYKKALLEASTETGIAADEMSEAVYSAISASVAQDDAIEFAKKASALAKGGFTSTATAVDVLTTAINAYGLSVNDTGKISDMLINTQNLGKTTVDELASSMGKIIPTANSYGVSLDVLCGAYAEVTKNGIATAEATTYMNSMLNELGKSGTIASDILKKKTKMSFKECMDSGMSLTDVLGILQDEADRTGMSMGDMFGSAEAGKAATVLQSNAEDLTKCIQSMGEVSGATEQAAAKMSNTTEARVNKIKNTLKNLTTQLGTALLPVAEKVIGAVESAMPTIQAAFQKLAGLVEPTIELIKNVYQQVILAYQKVVSAMNSVSSAISSAIGWCKQHKTQLELLAIGIATITTAIIAYNAAQAISNAGGIVQIAQLAATAVGVGALTVAETAHTVATTIATAATTAFSTALAFLTSPITLIIAAIGILIAVGVVLMQHWDEVKAKATEIFQAVADWIGAKITAIGNFFTNCKNTIVNLFGNIGSWFSEKFSSAWNGIKNAFSSVGSFFTGVWNTIKNIFKSIGGAIGSAVSNAFSSAINWVLSKAIGIINGFISAINACIGVINHIPGVEISKLNKLDVPQLAEGGVLDKGRRTVIAGEDGAEAIVPLEKNTEWINRVATQMQGAMGNTEALEALMKQVITLMKKILQQIPDSIDVNDREFARLVRSVDNA